VLILRRILPRGLFRVDGEQICSGSPGDPVSLGPVPFSKHQWRRRRRKKKKRDVGAKQAVTHLLVLAPESIKKKI